MHSRYCSSPLLCLYILCIYLSSAEHAIQQTARTKEPRSSQQNFNETEEQATDSSQIERCGGDVFENDTGTLAFPSGGGNYSNYQTCKWWIHVPFSKNIEIWFTSVDIPNTLPNCSHSDHVTLYDGYKHGFLLGKFCGGNMSSVLRSHSSVVGVEFKSDDENTGFGFVLQFVAIQRDVANKNPFARGINEPDILGDGDTGYNTTRNARSTDTSSDPLAMFMSFSLSQMVTTKKSKLEEKRSTLSDSYPDFQELTTSHTVEQNTNATFPDIGSLLQTKSDTKESSSEGINHEIITSNELITELQDLTTTESEESTTSRSAELGTSKHEDKRNATTDVFLEIRPTDQGIMLCDLLEKTLSSTFRNMQTFQEVGFLVSHQQEGDAIVQLAVQADQIVQSVLSKIVEVGNYSENSDCIKNVSTTYSDKLIKIRENFNLVPTPAPSVQHLTTDGNIADNWTTADNYPDHQVDLPNIGINHFIEFLNNDDLENLCLELNTSLTVTIESLQILQELESIRSIDGKATNEDTFQVVINNVKKTLFNLIAQFELFESNVANDTCLNEVNKLLSQSLQFTHTNGLGSDGDFSQREKFICSTELTAAHGVMYSPGYPRAYPNSLACEWFISVNPGKMIAVKFIDFKIDSVPQTTGCDRSYDYIEVVYWLDRMIRKVDVFCGVIPPPVIVSLSNQMSIILRTNDMITNDGFIAVYTEVNQYPVPDPSNIAFPIGLADAFLSPTNSPAITVSESDTFRVLLQGGGQCIKYLVETQGTFSSREMLRDPMSLERCAWNILTEPWKSITLHLTFNLSPPKLDGTCDPFRAYLLIIKNDSSLQDGPLCGNQEIQRISLGNSMKVVVNLNSESDVSFQARYTTQDNTNIESRFYLPDETITAVYSDLHEDVFPSCGEILKTREGIILSPNYPGEYTMNINCLWSILANHDEYIILQFNDFDLDSVSHICDDMYSKVIIHYYNDDSNIVSTDFCGKRLPGVVVSKGNQLTITFKSLNGYGRGFSAKYKTIPLGLFSTIKSGKGLDYFIEHGYDDEISQSTTLGYNVRRLFIDSYVDTEDASPDCSFRLTDTFGTFSSPVNPDGFYPNVLVCIWNIIASSVSRISLHFIELSLDGPRTEVCDTEYAYITVLRTNEYGMVEVERYCGDEDLPIITSYGQLVLKFNSKNGIDTGFKAKYISNDLAVVDTMSSGCIFTSRNSSGEIKMSSASFQQYQHSRVCIWNILAEADHDLYLNFDYFRPDLASEGTCKASSPHFIVTYTDSIGREIDDVYCGIHPSVFTSNSGNMWLKLFNMDENTEFKASYSSETATSKVIESVDRMINPCLFTLSGKEGEFDNLGTENVHTECVWKITVDSQFVIILTFEETRLTDCNQLVVVDVRDGLPFVVDSCVIRENAFLSSSNYLEIKKLYSFNLKFKCKYRAVNPFVDGFRMLGPPDQMVTSSVDQLILSSMMTLKESLHEITKPDTYSSEYSVDASTNEPQPEPYYRPTDVFGTMSRKQPIPLNTLTLLTTAPPIEQTGTEITTDLTCDTVFRSLNGSIKSPRYPHSYSSSTECTWRISVGDAGFVVLDFLDFDINRYSLPNECEPMYGYLDIISVPNYKILRRMCGPTLPLTFFTNSSDVKIVLLTQYGFGRGFHLLYYTTVTAGELRMGNRPVTQSPFTKLIMPTTTVRQHAQRPCFTTLADPSGSFYSPGYPTGNLRNINCRWEITSPNNEFILLEFHDFDIGQDTVSFDPKCSEAHAYVEIFNIRLGKSHSDVRFCGNNKPDRVISNSHFLIISMVTSYYEVKGFRAKYKEVGEAYISKISKTSSTTTMYKRIYKNTETTTRVNSNDPDDPHTGIEIQQRVFLNAPNSNLSTASPPQTHATLHNGGDTVSNTLTYGRSILTNERVNTGQTSTRTRVDAGNTLTYQVSNTTTRWVPGMRVLGMLPHVPKNSSKRNFSVPVVHRTENMTLVARRTTTQIETATTGQSTTAKPTTLPMGTTTGVTSSRTSHQISTTIQPTESKQKENLLSKSETRLALYIAVGIAGIIALLFLVLVAVCTRHSRSIDIQAAHQEILHPTYRTWGSPPSRFPAEHERLV